MPRRKPFRPVPPKKDLEEESGTWWHRLRTGDKVLSLIGFLTLLAASLVIPEVRIFLGLSKDAQIEIPAQRMPKSPEGVMTRPETERGEQHPSTPRYQIAPLPNVVVPAAKAEKLIAGGKKVDVRTESPVVSAAEHERLPDAGAPVETAVKNDGPRKTPKGSVGDSGIQLASERAALFVPEVVPEADAAKHLIHQVKPSYPLLGRQARIHGSVVLQITIGEDGSVKEVKVVSGHPMLVPSAVEAMKLWRYEPFVREGEPVVTTTTVRVDFGEPQK